MKRLLERLVLAACIGACSSEPQVTAVQPDPSTGSDGGMEFSGDGDSSHEGDGDAAEGIKLPDPVHIERCTPQTSGLTAERIDKLKAGDDPGDMRFLYPYDGTVFPRGLTAPVLMWETGATAADAVYVHMSSGWFEFSGCMKPDAEGRVALLQQLQLSAGAFRGGVGGRSVADSTGRPSGSVLGTARLRGLSLPVGARKPPGAVVGGAIFASGRRLCAHALHWNQSARAARKRR